MDSRRPLDKARLSGDTVSTARRGGTRFVYQWLVFIHLVGVVGFLLFHGVTVGVLFALRRERDPARIGALLGLSASSMSGFYVSLLVLLGGGLAANFYGPLKFDYVWPWLSLGILVVISVLMTLLARPYYERIRRIMTIHASGGQAVGPAEIEQATSGPQPLWIAGIGVAGIIGIVYLMTLKPF